VFGGVTTIIGIILRESPGSTRAFRDFPSRVHERDRWAVRNRVGSTFDPQADFGLMLGQSPFSSFQPERYSRSASCELRMSLPRRSSAVPISNGGSLQPSRAGHTVAPH
jgi:hypothetical protein